MGKNDTQRCSGRERIRYLNIIAEKDKEIAGIKNDCRQKLAEKNAVIDYYRRAAEQATRSKHRALNRQGEQRKDVIAWAVLALCVAGAVWLTGAAVHTFILWASGR